MSVLVSGSALPLPQLDLEIARLAGQRRALFFAGPAGPARLQSRPPPWLLGCGSGDHQASSGPAASAESCRQGTPDQRHMLLAESSTAAGYPLTGSSQLLQQPTIDTGEALSREETGKIGPRVLFSSRHWPHRPPNRRPSKAPRHRA